MNIYKQYNKLTKPSIKLSEIPERQTPRTLISIEIFDRPKLIKRHRSGLSFDEVYSCQIVKRYQYWELLYSHEINPGVGATAQIKNKIGTSKTELNQIVNEFSSTIKVSNLLGLGNKLTIHLGENVEISEEHETSITLTFPKREIKTLWVVYQLIDVYVFFKDVRFTLYSFELERLSKLEQFKFSKSMEKWRTSSEFRKPIDWAKLKLLKPITFPILNEREQLFLEKARLATEPGVNFLQHGVEAEKLEKFELLVKSGITIDLIDPP